MISLKQLPGWPGAARFLSEVLEPSTVRGYYQPLSMISLMIDYAFGGRPGELGAFHRTSLILHVANTALIVGLLQLLFRRVWVAALVGLLFGLHPLTVEPVAWVGERKTVLASFFALLSLVLYVGHARRRNLWLLGGALFAFLLALMSKPTTTPLPALLLLLCYWPLRRLSGRAVVEKLPFVALAGVAVVVTVISQGRTAQLTAPTEYSPVRGGLVLCHNIVFYLYKIVWPVAVAPFEVVITAVNPKGVAVSDAANALYDALVAEGIEVLLDDREERPGVKFKDADLVGIPYRMTVGPKGLKEGKIEIARRKTGRARGVDLPKAAAAMVEIIQEERGFAPDV